MPFITDEETKNKLVVLYLFHRVNLPLTGEQVNLAMASFSSINLFELSATLSSLAETNMLALTGASSIVRYHITENGRETLELFCQEIPFSIRQKIEEREKEIRRQARREMEYRSDYRKLEEGRYLAELFIMEGERMRLHIRMEMDSLSQAGVIARSWEETGGEVYRLLIAPVTEKE